MWTWLLSPKNAILVALLLALAVLMAVVGIERVQINTLKAEISTLKANVKTLTDANSAKDLALDGCAKSTGAVRTSNEQMQGAVAKAAEWKRKYEEATRAQGGYVPAPGEPCISGGKIDEGHKSALASAIADYNARMFKKGSGGKPPGASPGTVLPAAGPSR